ncbi:hypothetical protein PsYK624_146420 [Phanerochaete sordida]|uniref:Reverse transcriptase n=1 Tax=Phanerochaete sordida TaxID=48140 RepID=A0A9P3LLK7_9APHY|nr:hypothetical protein PsYK624_146420 [Phanerochaete sordida]
MTLPTGDLNFLNVYNDSTTHSAVTHLVDVVDRLPQLSFMAGDFNLRHPMWNAGCQDMADRRQRRIKAAPCDDLIQLATTELQLALLNDPNGGPTWQSNNPRLSPGVLDLVWVDGSLGEYHGLEVLLDHRFRSDHAILRWTMPLYPQARLQPSLGRSAEEVEAYLADVAKGIADLPTTYTSREQVEAAGEHLQVLLDDAWKTHARTPRPSKHAKSWWNQDCAVRARALRREREALRQARREKRAAARAGLTPGLRDLHRETLRLQESCHNIQNSLRRATRQAKRKLFDSLLDRLQAKNVWEAATWTRPRKARQNVALTTPEGTTADTPDQVRHTLQTQYTSHTGRGDPSILDDIAPIPTRSFPPFSAAEFHENLRKTNNSSCPGPDHLNWQWLKRLTREHPDVAPRLVILFNACIVQGIAPTFFKRSCTVVVPKPNKADYTKAKSYRPIVLLNCIGKLLEKMIAARMQFDGQKFAIMHPCQYGGTIQHSTTDAGIMLVHNIREAWAKGLSVSALLLDVAQFFPSIQHDLLTKILRKQGFAPTLCGFLEDYLVGRRTQFIFNGQTLDPTDFTVGVGQGSALSPVLAGLYIALVLHKWAPVQRKRCENLNIQFFVDDGLISVASPIVPGDHSALDMNNAILAHAFHDLNGDLERLGLGVETDKLELMHFRKRTRPRATTLGPDLVLQIAGRLHRVTPKEEMRYLGFYLDPALSFRSHIKFYTTKATSTVAALRMLGNSVRGLSPISKRKLYISNVLPLMLYGAQLWWTPTWAGRKWAANLLQKAQSRAARWISGCFRTTPVGAMDMAAGLIPVRPQIDQYMKRAAIRLTALPAVHPIRRLVVAEQRSAGGSRTKAQRAAVGPSPVVIAAEQSAASNEQFYALDDECRPGERICDVYAARIHVDLGDDAPPKAKRADFRTWLLDCFKPKLQEIVTQSSNRLLFTDGSADTVDGVVRAGAAWAVYDQTRRVAAGTVGIGRATPYDAEAVALARGLRDATVNVPPQTSHLHVFTDNKSVLDKLLKGTQGPGQMQLILACRAIRSFLTEHPDRQVTLHWCPAHEGVAQNESVDRDAKTALHMEQPPATTYARAKQDFATAAMSTWRDMMDSSRYRGRANLLRVDCHERVTQKAKTHYLLRPLGNNNKEFARAARFLSGHFPHGEFRQRFNLPGRQACQCGAPMETREHIMYDCPLWLHPFPRPHTRGPRNPRSALYLDDEDDDDVPLSDRPNDSEVLHFLRLNPMVATFEWYDLLDKVDKDDAARQAQSYHRTLLDMHTMAKQAAWRRFRTQDPYADSEVFIAEWDPDERTRDALMAWQPP